MLTTSIDSYFSAQFTMFIALNIMILIGTMQESLKFIISLLKFYLVAIEIEIEIVY